MGITSINITKQTLKALSQFGTVIALAICAALPALAADSNTEMEASAMCADGRCFAPQKDTGLSSLQNAVKGLVQVASQTTINPARTEELYVNPREMNNRRPADPVHDPETSSVVKIVAKIPLEDGRAAMEISTGFFISPCHIMTNSHSIFGTNDMSANTTRKPSVRLVLSDNTEIKTAEVKLGSREAALGDSREDKAVLFIPSCPGKDPKIGWMTIYPTGNYTPEEIKTAGFPSDLYDGRLWVVPKCNGIRFLGTDHKILSHDCATRPGNSGGPIYTREKIDGKNYVVAMHVAVDPSTGQYLAISSNNLYKDQKRFLKEAEEYMASPEYELVLSQQR